MSGRADHGGRDAVPRKRLPGIDRVWLGRIALAFVVTLGVVLVARVSMMAFSGGSQRVDRYERSTERAQGDDAPSRVPGRP
jgi:hypothetical protein